ncbi:MAG: hypothetical protein PHD86_00470 [Kiritimatiellae bacterium]|nr:hypothetical protein [Kiritimatiellia bacterium]
MKFQHRPAFVLFTRADTHTQKDRPALDNTKFSKGDGMNLKNASTHHRNIVMSFAALFAFAYFAGIRAGKEYNPAVIAVVFSFFLFQIVSFCLLARELDKNRILWTIAAILSPYLLFIPFLVLIISANKVFKANGWKVKYYGGAVYINTLSNGLASAGAPERQR